MTWWDDQAARSAGGRGKKSWCTGVRCWVMRIWWICCFKIEKPRRPQLYYAIYGLPVFSHWNSNFLVPPILRHTHFIHPNDSRLHFRTRHWLQLPWFRYFAMEHVLPLSVGMSWGQVRIDLLDGVCQFSWAPIVLLFTLDWQHHSLHVLWIRPDIGLACPLSPSRLVWITMAFWLSMALACTCQSLAKFVEELDFSLSDSVKLLDYLCQLYPCHTEPLPHAMAGRKHTLWSCRTGLERSSSRTS